MKVSQAVDKSPDRGRQCFHVGAGKALPDDAATYWELAVVAATRSPLSWSQGLEKMTRNSAGPDKREVDLGDGNSGQVVGVEGAGAPRPGVRPLRGSPPRRLRR